ncbi:MAG: Asp23/Gls24 family envelope stress response protein [Lachnospiraceae bacterium]|nr:Asp23/Gls24 family envelope stress response protein [Lachnospiraceae bacterium]
MSQVRTSEVRELKEDTGMGSVKIADDVVAKIAILAAQEVEGIAKPSSTKATDLMRNIGYDSSTRGSKVEIYGKKVRVDIALTVEYGYNIPATCQKAQNKIQNTIENMTGLEVTDINIRIAGVHVG